MDILLAVYRIHKYICLYKYFIRLCLYLQVLAFVIEPSFIIELVFYLKSHPGLLSSHSLLHCMRY